MNLTQNTTQNSIIRPGSTQFSHFAASKPAARGRHILARYFDAALILSLMASSTAYAVVTLAQVA